MQHFAKWAALGALIVFGSLLLARDAAPVKYTKTLTALSGVALAMTISLAMGETLDASINHAIAGGALGGLAAFAAGAVKSPSAPPTDPPSPPKPPPLPILLVLLVVGACTPAERHDAETAARVAVPACTGLVLAEAPEVAPLCADLPEIVDAVSELVAEHQPATRAAVHRRCAARRTGGHRDAGP